MVDDEILNNLLKKKQDLEAEIQKLYAELKELTNVEINDKYYEEFNAPEWCVPIKGVAIAYQQLPDALIESLPIDTLQTDGFIFIWVINNKFVKAFELMEKWGRVAKGHGYYLQHAKETCLVGKKGKDIHKRGVCSDVIYSERRGQSQKPERIYEIIEELVPSGKYLEIFGRKNNLRDGWVTIGNEL
ncbi:hypothetical protein HK103_006891 [Boothiomyces macroporosus]|uniref:mRNA m(6)A methyltransferase n=1 Tax=Boothiomyces macroporosus TaxID=261099 RepID=A0AAD5Y6Q1_9FUNG|nr:hypothetical protein HK103_006891 [Boothiomyces macroporosus]